MLCVWLVVFPEGAWVSTLGPGSAQDGRGWYGPGDSVLVSETEE